MNILIIEDEAGIRHTLQDLLEINGHTVRAAADGIEGVKLAAERPDLILCDIGMPGMDGFEVITAIQRLPQGRDVPFIFLTARADRADQRLGMSLGADDYITKPFSERDILDAINARVGRLQPLRDRVEQLVTERHQEIHADWSHELMTPLNGVLGGLQLIEMEADRIKPDELKEILPLIRAGAERQQKLSRKLIRFFGLQRLKEKTPAPAAGRCHAETAITNGAMQVAQAARRETDLRIHCEPGVVALAEPLLSDAIAELADNAFGFSRPGQPVSVSGRPVNRLYRIEVVDAGPGMTPEQRSSTGAFKRFDRQNDAHNGLGLGLAIVRETASIAGGRLLLMDGPEGAGLKIVMEIPLAATASDSQDASEAVPQSDAAPIS